MLLERFRPSVRRGYRVGRRSRKSTACRCQSVSVGKPVTHTAPSPPGAVVEFDFSLLHIPRTTTGRDFREMSPQPFTPVIRAALWMFGALVSFMAMAIAGR